MKTASIDYLNIFLIAISLLLAIKLPFELFLFSYAFLGPLHYLTEINWLNKNRFFVSNSKIIGVFLFLSLIICSPPIIDGIASLSGLKNSSFSNFLTTKSYGTFKNLIPHAIFSALVIGVASVVFKKLWKILVCCLLGFIASYFLTTVPFYMVLMGAFIPTIIHVYVFTILFMLYGALKTKSKVGIVSVILLVLCILFISFIDIHPDSYIVSENTKKSFEGGLFSFVNNSLATFFMDNPKEFFLLSVLGIKIQIFIAFAYTYHYLNWFSKTSIIEWHKVDKKQFFIIAAIWLFSVSLYLYNYRLGFLCLLFLSTLHVVLEFPLNYISIKETVRIIFSSFRSKK